MSVVVHVSTLQEDDGSERLVAYLERPPLPGRGTRQLGASIADFSFTDSAQPVRRAGEAIYSRLVGHPEFQTALVQAMAVATDERCPLLVHLDIDGAADRIPWETLCAPDGTFLGLEPRWSVARVVDSAVKLPGTVAFQPPLRIAVLLSCLGISAADEWARLIQAVQASAVPVEILALVGEPDVEETIAKQAHPNVTVAGIPGADDFPELREQVVTFRPHVLHLFCHGSLRDGAHLELATQVDWLANAPVSSLFLEPNQVAALADPVERPWLAVLNCCEGAGASDQIHTLASSLVYSGGIAAVVGMREPIASDDATLFTERFYPLLLDAVARVAAGSPGVLDWSGLLVEPRRGLVQRRPGVFTAVAADRREWTLPVLYLRPEDFVVSLAAPPTPADLLRLEILRTIRATASATSPTTYVADLDRLIGELERHVAGP